MARKFFDHEQFNFELQCALGGVHYGAGDVGEMLSTADHVVDGDADSWCREWIATGQRVATIAEESAKSGHEVSARATYLRAATYYAMALSVIDGTNDPAPLLQSTFAEHRRCFDAYTELLDPPAEKVQIPYEGAAMPGYLFRPSTSDVPRRTLIMNNGSDGPVTSIWPAVSAGGVARGYNVLIFDGPGQQSMLFERGVPFRYDWEHVITHVMDFLLARPDVDPAQIALYGISQAGYWVPRALAFEHRIAAAIADPGVYDASRHGRKTCRLSCCSCSTPATSRHSIDSSTKGCRRRRRRSDRTGSGAQNRTACSPLSMCLLRPVSTTSPTWPIRPRPHC